ncbi:TonB-dependent receptor [Bacteroides sp.]
MRISLFLLFACAFQLLAVNTEAQNSIISFPSNSISVGQLIEEIEKQTDYLVVYSNREIDTNRQVTIQNKSAKVSSYLKETLAEAGIGYKFENDYIILSKNNSRLDRMQQQEKVTGIVTDVKGEPVIGANVSVVGKSIGTITDIDGKFAIQASQGNTLQISFIGYKAQTTKVTGKHIAIVLQEDMEMLDEVVVIGYGTVKKSDLTGSVSSISQKNIKDQPMTRLDQALSGRIPGVVVITNSGAPEQSTQIRIRGANSIYGGNSPLYIVDGVPNTDLFNNLAPNDIQSIEVLKDASATAIYGSRGANGVILVTTKRGAEGKTNIHLETEQSISTIAKKLDLLSASEYAEFYNEYRREKGATQDFFSQDEINQWKKNGGTDWQDLMFRTAHTQNYKLSISGGIPKLQYLVSMNMMDIEGILKESKSQKFSLRSNITSDVTNWLKMNLDMNAVRRKTNKNGPRGGVGTIIADAITYSPTLKLKDEEGNWLRDNINSTKDNPYGRLTQDLDESYTNYLAANLQFMVQLPVKGLSMNFQGAAHYKDYKNRWMKSNANDLRAQNNSANNNQNDSFDWYNVNQINYVREWKDHKLNLMGAMELSQSTTTGLSNEVANLRTESVEFWNLSLGNMNLFSNSFSRSSLVSFMGRAMYQFKDRYLLTATIRRDGSSKFQGKNKWGNFPSVAVAWRMSEESFIKNLNIFDVLKLRISWGNTGNQAIGAYSTLGLLAESKYGWGGTSDYPGYGVSGPATPNLTWEKTTQYDLGLDMAFANNRILANIDVYQKNTTGLLLKKPIPYYDGGGTTWVNLGEVKNRGLEFSLTGIPIQSKNLVWESTFNVSYSKNEVVSLGDETRLHPGTKLDQASLNTAVLQVGKPLGSIYGYIWEGLWRTDEADEAAKWGQKPGDNKFKEKNVNYKLESDDADIIGQAFPDVILGWSNTIKWKNLDFNLFFQGSLGADRLNLSRYLTNEGISDSRFITSKEGYYNRWTPENQNTKIPNPFSSTINSRFETAQYLEKADYLRLKNVSIAYTIPRAKTKFADIRISLSAQNLFTITSYTGYDPEGTMDITSNGGNSDINAGVDGGSYPLPRTFTLGLGFSF